MSDLKDALFLYESAELPDNLKLAQRIADEFAKLPQAETTLVQVAYDIDQAVKLISRVKERNCNTAYTLAILNLNRLSAPDMSFFLRPEVLGDPRAIFVASLRFMDAEVYAMARAKVQRESEAREMASSCLDCYSASNREEAAARVSQLAVAYIREAEEWVNARREGRVLGVPTVAGDLLRKSPTTFFGGAMKSGQWRSVNSGTGRMDKSQAK